MHNFQRSGGEGGLNQKTSVEAVWIFVGTLITCLRRLFV